MRLTPVAALTACPRPEGPRRGEVWLVGAGPGDPRLMTLAAADAVRVADIVLHDTLPEAGFRAFMRPEAEAVDVGKRKGDGSSHLQSRIGSALIAAARAGLRVVRLKGGDPLLFGRAGEEMAALTAAGIPFRIVPGVTSATAAAAAAGIPLTLRGTSRAVSFITGHDQGAELPEDVDWPAQAASGATLVAFMALSRLDQIALRLLAAGRSPATPVAIVSRATLPGERVLLTSLGACTLEARRAALPMPALVIVGEVVATAIGGIANPARAAL